MNGILKKLDIFQREPRLYLSGKQEFPTKYGVVIGTMTIFACISFICYFIVDYYEKTTINLVQNTLFYDRPVYKFGMTPFIFNLQNSYGDMTKESHFYFTFSMTFQKPENNGKSTKFDVEMEKCDINKHFGESRNLFEKKSKIDDYYCIRPDQLAKNLTIYGVFGDLTKGYSYVNLYISKCNNNSIYNTKNVTCAPQEEINDALDKTIYLRIAYIDYKVDHNEKNPISPFVREEALQVTTKNYPRVYYNMKNEIYKTDNGVLGQNFEEFEFTAFDNTYTVLSMNPFRVQESFTLFSILVSQSGTLSIRSFIKLQTLLANIGGVVNAVILIMKTISMTISEKLLMAYIINKTFNLNSNKKFNPREKNYIHNLSISVKSKIGMRVLDDGKSKEGSMRPLKQCYSTGISPTLFTYNRNPVKPNFIQDSNFKNTKIPFTSQYDTQKLILNNPKVARKKEGLRLTFKELICPMSLVKSKNEFTEFFNKIKKFLSIDTIIKYFIQLEIMKTILLNENDVFLLSNLPNLTPKIYNKIFSSELLNEKEKLQKMQALFSSRESKVASFLNKNE